MAAARGVEVSQQPPRASAVSGGSRNRVIATDTEMELKSEKKNSVLYEIKEYVGTNSKVF